MTDEETEGLIDMLVELLMPNQQMSLDESEDFAGKVYEGALAYGYSRKWTKKTTEDLAARVKSRIEWKLSAMRRR